MATYPRSKAFNRPSPPISAKAARAVEGQVAKPRVSQLASRSIETASDVVEHMSAVISDIENNLLLPQQANAVCNAMSKLLKVVDMQYRYGLHGRSRLLLVEANGKQTGNKTKKNAGIEFTEEEDQVEG